MSNEHYADEIRRYWRTQGFAVECRVTDVAARARSGQMTHVRSIVSNLQNGLPRDYHNGANGMNLGLPSPPRSRRGGWFG